MDRLRSAVTISFFAFLLAGALSCGTSIQSRGTGASPSANESGVEDSGRHLAGAYDLAFREDPYRRDSQAHIAFTFDDNGTFTRDDLSRIEEGSYLITNDRELVLYVEKVNGEQRPAATVELYQISGERDDSFTLRGGSIGEATFRKR
jgi:hypothetical protein